MCRFGEFECIKYSLLFLNILFVISGIVITLLGVYIKAFYYSYEVFVDEQYLYVPDCLIALGAVIFVVAFVGCCGVLSENICMNLAFTTFLVLIFFFEVGIGLAGYIMKNEAKIYLLEKFSDSMTNYNATTDIRLAWDTIQKKFDCCGVAGYKDWETRNIKVPSSCYTQSNHTKILHEIGCIQTFGTFVQDHSSYIEMVGIGLTMLQLFGILSACYLNRSHRKGYETV